MYREEKDIPLRRHVQQLLRWTVPAINENLFNSAVPIFHIFFTLVQYFVWLLSDYSHRRRIEDANFLFNSLRYYRTFWFTYLKSWERNWIERKLWSKIRESQKHVISFAQLCTLNQVRHLYAHMDVKLCNMCWNTFSRVSWIGIRREGNRLFFFTYNILGFM